MPLLYRQARSKSPTFLDSPEGLALWHQMEADSIKESITAAGFSFPVLAVHSAATGFMSAGVCREAGHCELMTPTAASPGLFFPVHALYIELATLRTAQSMFTEERWRRACQTWQRERRRATVGV